MGIKEEAVALHSQGFNCAQCVLGACGKYTGLDQKSSLAVAGGFGGGVRCGEICGAISGAVMAIGAANPFSDASDRDAMMRVASLTKQCTGAFRERFGELRCLDLKRAGVPCDELIAFGAETVEKLINDNKE
ncbi:MAG: C_GCAxxG_C_C family protein [Oscillospiraceae bacterium]|nr:C_GCAxxG_C_C family protein [Oscillospiraceae bacterium]